MKTKILFICLGNICRSPAAHAIMQKMVDERGLSHLFEIDSAGIGPWHVGELPDARMRKHGSARGYNLQHRARQYHAAEDLLHFDLIVTMDDENYKRITATCSTKEQMAKVKPMATFFTANKRIHEVPDPYYGGDSGFELVLDLLEDGCSNIIEQYASTEL